MTDLDILAALEASPGAHDAGFRCKIGRWLDEIPEDQPGKDRLTAILSCSDPLSPDYRTGEQLDVLLLRLGLKTSIRTIFDHKSGKRCRCYR